MPDLAGRTMAELRQARDLGDASDRVVRSATRPRVNAGAAGPACQRVD